ncbi:Short-chain dehydrogenase/reductase SDR (plasmid) [Neorhizobium galegae bv. officinalis bv. officinalis str. HAMBI 1141]|uniref:Short-chain dehydrogenase/reductase SDR n=1 Tax=Neorhizobium galegae bv. officinalis bv. officinalis str. HAMBI 1141 TaxID=1028801 RepID=A0A068TGQ7_NEOGA|nr:Short-chain dehydrogenase/reductase SDR [Neorhizobium galegae bv. officinalis bv. officinalis str. HAMBI 1141]
MHSFHGRNAVVTGANSGIGRATIDLLIGRGACVLAVDLDVSQLGGVPAITVSADLSEDSAPKRIAEAAGELGDLDLLVNCAGVGGSKRIAETDDALLDRILGINLRSVIRLTRELLPLLRRPGGAIVNLASVYGEVGRVGTTAYAASKGGISQLTRQLSAEVGPEGIRVNAVAPGCILTAMTRTKIDNDPEYRRAMIAGTPLRRVGDSTEVAEVIAFLGSDQASFVNGQIVAVDGGWLASGGHFQE